MFVTPLSFSPSFWSRVADRRREIFVLYRLNWDQCGLAKHALSFCLFITFYNCIFLPIQLPPRSSSLSIILQWPLMFHHQMILGMIVALWFCSLCSYSYVLAIFRGLSFNFFVSCWIFLSLAVKQMIGNNLQCEDASDLKGWFTPPPPPPKKKIIMYSPSRYFNGFERSLLCSPRLHLFAKKIQKNSNIVKCYNLK